MSPNDNKRILQNTLFMYVRMFIIMLISLYTSRIVLNTLGISDYGIYNVVGGIVVMFSFLNSAMSASTQRFLTIEIGKDNFNGQKNVFKTSVILHLLIAVLLLILSESIGVWFINTQLNIPVERLYAANWAFQFTVLSMVFSIIGVPFNATIISHEHFRFYAYISVVEVVLRLLIVFTLQLFLFDKLILYAIFVCSVNLLIQILYYFYCKNKFEIINFGFSTEKSLYKEMSSFASWNLFGVFAGIGYNQGVNVLLNVFFSPAINAARAISFQILSAVNQVVTNFQVTVNPSIIKNYVLNDEKDRYNLVFTSSKFSYFLLLIFITPIYFRIDWVLATWLKTVPDYTISFTRLVLIDSLICSLSGPLHTLVQATGKIKVYQTVVSTTLLLNLPLSYIILKMTSLPYLTVVVAIGLSTLALVFRLVILEKMENFPILDYLKDVILKVIIVTILVIPIPLLLQNIISNQLCLFIVTFILSFISLIIAIWIFGINKNERRIISDYLQKLKLKIINR